ncbi:MAG: MarR family winged helix-turn-helix transcriptional regulator [Actinomycetes bacterium]
MPERAVGQQPCDAEQQAVSVEEASLALVEMTLGALAASGEVSTLQLRVLLVVDRHAPLNLSSLATRLDLSVPSASRLVDRLVDAGLVARGVAAHSRREVALSLTAKGRRALAQLRRSRERAIGQVLGEMAPRDRDALVAGLHAFARAADA